MSKSGVILLVEDDMDDKDVLVKTIRDVGVKNEIVWLETTQAALDFLLFATQSIFIILSDINLPGNSGLDLKLKIDSNPKLRKRSIPFIFFSTSASQKDVNDAYTKMTVQGFFKKGADYDETKVMIKTIFDYWTICKHPNTH